MNENMAGLFTIDNFTITSLDRIHAYSRTNKKGEMLLTELQSTTISNTEDTVDITGKGGRLLKQIKRNKAVSVTGVSALLSGDLMAAQTGSSQTYGDYKVRYPDIIDVTATVVSSGKVTTTYTAVGTEGAEIVDVRVLSDNGGLIANSFTQGSTATTNKYAYNPTTKELSLPTNIEITAGQKLVVMYDFLATGARVVNESDVFGKTLYLAIDCTGVDACDNEYRCQFIIYRAQFSGEFDMELGGDQTVQNFTANSLVDTCAATLTNGLWEFIVYKDESTTETATLSGLTVADAVLSPTFDADTTSYTTTVTAATSVVTATAENGTNVVITVNGDSITSGTAATWQAGNNTVVITASKPGANATTYYLTVTKS